MYSDDSPECVKRYIVNIVGIVQGVGYRPYIYKMADRYQIRGWVSNMDSMVLIDAEGQKECIRDFLLAIIKHPPSLARIERISVLPKECANYIGFYIRESRIGNDKLHFAAPDVSTCPECIKDILQAGGRRFTYAFTNCTACGPRYSIILGMPYDRHNTTMQEFTMCSSCQAEYDDPSCRRFHAQPNCCPVCGPKLTLVDNKGNLLSCENPIREVIELIKNGKIIAVKGLGGFHLACNARDAVAVNILRERKKRPHKPLAVMVKNIDTAKELCLVSTVEEQVLTGNKRPIVLLEKRKSYALPDNLAPFQNKLGVMLAYTPLHFLLFGDGLDVIVMTSGNISGGPMQYKEEEAVNTLSQVADYFLIHNREINIPVDDSVVKVLNEKEVVVRRARGYAPLTIFGRMNNEILALGAEQKGSFCLSQNGYMHFAQYIGDLKDFDTYNAYKSAIRNFLCIYKAEPKIFVHDLHPAYLSTRYVNSQQGKKLAVQHHHAHMVSCMVEHSIFDEVIGVIYDGTGLGTDGKIWGGEFFVGTRSVFRRVGHLKYVRLLGGELAVKETWRIALSYLYLIGEDADKILYRIGEEKINNAKLALAKGVNCFETSSMGRLFDCVAALLGLRDVITYDAQAAIELENIIDDSTSSEYDFPVIVSEGLLQMDYQVLLLQIIADLRQRIPIPRISAKFHNTIASATLTAVCEIRKTCRLNKVVLSGGVFENSYLLRLLVSKLSDNGFEVYHNQQIPFNDGGISVGQLAIADSLLGGG